VRFREGQPLTAVDLNAEEGAIVAYRTAHNLSHHAWGIVSGLQLEITTVNGLTSLNVAPGSAVDGYGRELYVPEPVIVPVSSLAQFFSGATKGFDVWLVYRLGKGSSAGRVSEQTIVRITVPVPGPRTGKPSSVSGEWPVFLGHVTETVEVDTTRFRYAGLRGERLVSSSSDPTGATRIRVGIEDDGSGPVVAFGVQAGDACAASGQQRTTQIRLLNGVNIGGPAPQSSTVLTQAIGTTATSPALRNLVISKAIDLRLMLSEADLCGLPPSGQNLLVIAGVNNVLHFVVFDAGGKKAANVGEADLLGTSASQVSNLKTTLGGLSSRTDPNPAERDEIIAQSLAIINPSLPFTSISFDPLTTPPPNPVNWRIYRVVVPDPNPKNPPTEQLRVEFFNPGGQGDPARSTFVVRLSDGTNKYTALTASADGNVTIGDLNNVPGTNAGTLHIIGQLVESQVKINPNDPRFTGQLSNQLLTGAISSRVVPVLNVDVKLNAASAVRPKQNAVFDITITRMSDSPGPVAGIQVYGNATIPTTSSSSAPTVVAVSYDSSAGTLTVGIPANAQVGGTMNIGVIAMGTIGSVLIAVGQPGPFSFTITT